MDWNAQLFTKLYSKLALALGVTPREEDPELRKLVGGPLPPRYRAVPTANSDDPQFLLAILNPGQYIPATLDPANKKEDRYALSVLLNSVPQFSWVFRPAATTVSNAYMSVLEYKQTPESQLTPAQKDELEANEATIAEYKSVYDEYQQKYWDALDAYDAAYATWENGGPPIPRTLRLKLEAALRDWNGLGHKQAVESAIAVVAALEGLEPESFWAKLMERYRRGTEETRLGSSFQVVGVSPPYKSWFAEEGWTEFTFKQKDMDNQRQSQAIGVAGNLDMTYGIFRVSGDGTYQKDSKFVKMNQTDLTFSCKLMRVALDRSWMNPLVLSSRAWRWAPGTPVYGSKLSSGGDIFGDVAPRGDMTVLPTAAILSKDLVINGTFDNTIVEEMNMLIEANASVGIGPFSIAGRFNMEEHTGSEKGTIATNGIRAQDVQLLALVCQMLPESPNPDPALKWPAP
jgi:hypothetical protein